MKLKHILTLSLMALAMTSCSLDEDVADRITEKQSFANAEQLYINTVATLYNHIGGSQDSQSLQGTCRGVYDLQTFGSDEALIPTRGTNWYDGGIWQTLYCHSWDAGFGLLNDTWNYLYKVVMLCNRSLDNLQEYRQMLTDQQYNAYTAEVRALRAIYYWYLLDLFGNVPIVTSTKANDWSKTIKQSQRSEVFEFTVNELDEASKVLPNENSTKPGEYYGRVTRPVVLFVLAKLMLNAEVYNGSQQWENVIELCNEIENLGYQLEPNYIDNFTVANENSHENIFTIVCDQTHYMNQQQNMFRSMHYRHAAVYGFTGENGSSASKRTMEIYGFGTKEIDNRFDYNFWSGNIYDLNDNIVRDSEGNPLIYYPLQVRMDLTDSPYMENAGARMKKYEPDLNAVKDGKLMDNDIVLFRFADVLLMRAEAKLRLGQDGQADYDRVRQRVCMPTRPITLQNLMDERLLELCWEGWRRQDMIRFGQYESLYDGKEPLHDRIEKVDESDGHTTLYPIPANAITMNGGLKQNPGY